MAGSGKNLYRVIMSCKLCGYTQSRTIEAAPKNLKAEEQKTVKKIAQTHQHKDPKDWNIISTPLPF